MINSTKTIAAGAVALAIAAPVAPAVAQAAVPAHTPSAEPAGVVAASAELLGTGARSDEERALRSDVDFTDVTDEERVTSSRQEVVAVVDGPHGPEVRKLRTDSQADARELADDLEDNAGVTASVNHVVEVESMSPTGQAPAAAAPATSVRSGQWGLKAVGATGAWRTSHGRGVLVAVIDTGVDASHRELRGHVREQIDVVPDGQHGDVFGGHGTHVAGIIAAASDGHGVSGLADQVDVLPVRVFDRTGHADDFTIAKGIHAATDAGADVVNLSLRASGPSPVVREAVDYAQAHGATVVASVGNHRKDGNPTTYPAAFPGVIGVTSVGRSGRVSSFGDTGSYVDIAAPGERISSTMPGGRTGTKTGTSMATPFVSATAALVRATNPLLTKDQVDSILMSTAKDDSARPGRDDYAGAGRLRADRAVRAAGGASSSGGSCDAPSVKAKAVRHHGRLRVDIGPDRLGTWRFTVQVREGNGSWRDARSYKTHGRHRTRTVNMRAGTYRVRVAEQHGCGVGQSGEVTLTR